MRAAVEQLRDKVNLYVCEQETSDARPESTEVIGLLVGPEGGWSDAEKQYFTDQGLKHVALHDFTLRAETACVAAVSVTLGL